jgi:hypothetical protein
MLPRLRLEYATVLSPLRPLRNYGALALVLPALVAVAGCGGGGDDGGDKLSANDQLRVIQDTSAILEFCSVSKAPQTSDIYVRDLDAAIDATADLGEVAKKAPGKRYVNKTTKVDKPLRDVVAEEVNRLTKKCSAEGKKLGERLQRTAAG